MPAKTGTERLMKIPYSTKLTESDLQGLRDRARAERTKPAVLLRSVLRQYLQTPQKPETPVSN